MAEGTKGLPDVPGLEQVVKDLVQQDKDKVVVQGGDPGGKTVDLAQFKNPEDLLKSYKEIQGAFTKVAQDNKDKEGKLAELETRMLEMQQKLELGSAQPGYSQNIFQGDGSEVLKNYLGDEGLTAIDSYVVNRMNTMRIAEVLEEEEGKSPEDFQERYAYAMTVAKTYPHLRTNSMGVRKLFAEGDKLRERRIKETTDKAIKTVFGEDVDIEKMKGAFRKEVPNNANNINLAYMPETSGSVRTGADTGQKDQDYDTKINEASKKGDADTVLDLLFKKQLGQ